MLLTYTAQVIKVTLDPVWKPTEVSLAEFCNGQLERVIKVRVFTACRHY